MPKLLAVLANMSVPTIEVRGGASIDGIEVVANVRFASGAM